MSKTLVECPSCGRKVPSEGFCRSCGSALPKGWGLAKAVGPGSQLTESSSDSGDPDVRVQPNKQTLPGFSISIEGADSRVLSILLAQAELQLIGRDLDKLIGQIEATRQALLLKHADKTILASRAEGLKQAFEMTKSRREQLMAARGLLPIESILEKLKVQELKLSKLEGLSGSIDPQVYDEEHDEITHTISRLRDDLKKATDEVRGWLKAMNRKIGDLKRDASRLDARYKIGDIPANTYEKSRSEVGRSITILEGSQELLKSVLTAAEAI